MASIREVHTQREQDVTPIWNAICEAALRLANQGNSIANRYARASPTHAALMAWDDPVAQEYLESIADAARVIATRFGWDPVQVSAVLSIRLSALIQTHSTLFCAEKGFYMVRRNALPAALPVKPAPTLHKVVISCDNVLSALTIEQNGGQDKRGNWWWLKGPQETRGGFVRLRRPVPGHRPFPAQEFHLPRGTYTLGVGPPIGGIRKTILVSGQLEMFAGFDPAQPKVGP